MKARLLTGLAFALAGIDAWRLVPAQAADIKTHRSGQECRSLVRRRSHRAHRRAGDRRCRRARPMIRPARPGLAAFAAALIDEGAGNMDSKAFHDALADHAIQFRASVERDYLVISIVTLTENLPEAMHLLQTGADPSALRRRSGDAGAHPDDPGHPARRQPSRPTVARRAFAKAFFNGHPYGHPADGDAASHVRHHRRRSAQLRPQPLGARAACKIAVAGDITAAGRHQADRATPSSRCRAPRRRRRRRSASWASPASM